MDEKFLKCSGEYKCQHLQFNNWATEEDCDVNQNLQNSYLMDLVAWLFSMSNFDLNLEICNKRISKQYLRPDIESLQHKCGIFFTLTNTEKEIY